jgi:hypothetical protein
MVTEELFDKFADYMLSRNDLAYGTMTQYLSRVYQKMKSKFPELNIWEIDLQVNSNGSAPRWYFAIRNNAIRNGVMG